MTIYWMTKKTYRTDELAEAWGVSRKTVQREIKRGELPAFKVGSDWRVKDEEREKYEKKRD